MAQPGEVTCPAAHSWEQGYNLQGPAVSTAAQEGRSVDASLGLGSTRGEKKDERGGLYSHTQSFILHYCTHLWWRKGNGCRQKWRPRPWSQAVVRLRFPQLRLRPEFRPWRSPCTSAPKVPSCWASALG